jgi:ABC-type glutathione transport system ATPase component
MTLAVTDLSVSRAGQTLLHPTSLEIEASERIGLVGVSGSGKSTLGHALVDALRARNHRIAHVPQSPDEALDPLRSLKFHWREAEKALALAPNEARRADLFKSLSIHDGDLRKRPWGWSRGMQQRFVIALGLIDMPELLILDEPTSALDPVVAAETMDLLDRYLSHSETAMVLITHDLGLAAQNVSRLMVMHEGAVVEDAPTQQLLQHPQTAAARNVTAYRSWCLATC